MIRLACFTATMQHTREQYSWVSGSPGAPREPTHWTITIVSAGFPSDGLETTPFVGPM